MMKQDGLYKDMFQLHHKATNKLFLENYVTVKILDARPDPFSHFYLFPNLLSPCN